jgi:hypothetical protein
MLEFKISKVNKNYLEKSTLVIVKTVKIVFRHEKAKQKTQCSAYLWDGQQGRTWGRTMEGWMGGCG